MNGASPMSINQGKKVCKQNKKMKSKYAYHRSDLQEIGEDIMLPGCGKMVLIFFIVGALVGAGLFYLIYRLAHG